MHKIFIVEDDPVIAQEISRRIEVWGFTTRCAANFENVLSEFAGYDPQLVLMDVSLPFFSGYYWCAEIRKVSKVPIIFISSASDNMNIVMAVNMGGDDFSPSLSTWRCSPLKSRLCCAGHTTFPRRPSF